MLVCNNNKKNVWSGVYGGYSKRIFILLLILLCARQADNVHTKHIIKQVNFVRCEKNGKQNVRQKKIYSFLWLTHDLGARLSAVHTRHTTKSIMSTKTDDRPILPHTHTRTFYFIIIRGPFLASRAHVTLCVF